jgi:hypothetical protein
MKTASRVRQHDRDDTNSSKSFTSSVMSAAASFWEAAVISDATRVAAAILHLMDEFDRRNLCVVCLRRPLMGMNAH